MIWNRYVGNIDGLHRCRGVATDLYHAPVRSLETSKTRPLSNGTHPIHNQKSTANGTESGLSDPRVSLSCALKRTVLAPSGWQRRTPVIPYKACGSLNDSRSR